MERLHNFKPGQAVRVRASGPGFSLCGCRISPGELFYFAYSQTDGRLKPEAVVMRQNKDFRSQKGLRFLLSDISPAPEPVKPDPEPTQGTGVSEEVKLYRARVDGLDMWLRWAPWAIGSRLGFTQSESMAREATESAWRSDMEQLAPDIRYTLIPVHPAPAPEGCISAQEALQGRLGPHWKMNLEATRIDTPEQLAKATGCSWLPEAEAPETVDSISKDRALELFLDAIHIGFESHKQKGFNRLEAVHYFSERLKDL